MKSIVVSGVLGLITLASSVTTALAQYSNHQWIRVTTDNNDNVYFLDKLVSGRGRYRRYWAATIPNQDREWRKFLYSIDCQTKQRRLRMAVYYDENDKIDGTANYGGDGPLEKVTGQMPVSLKIANVVCSMK